MKVVFTETVPGVATIGEERDVKAGYARNFLFPRRLAILPSDPQAKSLRSQRKVEAVKIADQKRVLAELAEIWSGKTFKTKARASEDGTLYGSVGVKEISKLLGRDDLTFEAPTLKKVGTHKIELKFIDGTVVPVTIIVEPEDQK